MGSFPRLIGANLRRKFLLALISAAGTCAALASGTDNLGAVASESRLCSEIGIELLRRGGNAADAMVGTTLCVGVVGMHHSGIGGGGFMIVRGSDGKYESIDYRETAPEAAHRDMYKYNVLASVFGGLASGVPGDLRGLEYLHNKYGSLPWRAVCNPAVHVARYGFPVTEDHVYYMKAAMSFNNNTNPFLTDDPQWAIDFAPNGNLLQLNDTMTRKRYANTLETIAEHGAKAFYEGEIANYTIKALQAQNGIMTLEDLKIYQVSIREPINITYNNYRLFSTGVPSSGAVALSILKIMESYSSSNSTSSEAEDIGLATHRLDEAMRYSYAARNELGDPDFFNYMTSLEAEMLKPEKAAKIRENILDDRTRNVSEYYVNHEKQQYFLPENGGTSHIVASDKTGLSISSTSTVNLLFGSQLMVPETGVILNNQMNDFSIPGVHNAFGFVPSPINYIAPGKRPLSSITPIIVEHLNGTLYLSIGAAGGSRIPTSTAQTTLHLLSPNLSPLSPLSSHPSNSTLSLPAALSQPRIHDQLLPPLTTFEASFNPEIVGSMRMRGHNVSWAGKHDSAVQGVRRFWNGSFEAAGEPRQRGSGGLSC